MPHEKPSLGLGEGDLRVGLFGGSFNPPHQGHLQVARAARKTLKLDLVVWLVAPANPLKNTLTTPLAQRITWVANYLEEQGEAEMMYPSGVEELLGTKESVETVAALRRLYPDVFFVWLVGSDIVFELERWPTWRRFVESVHLAIYPRPHALSELSKSILGTHPRMRWLEATQADSLSLMPLPCAISLEGPLVNISSTSLRCNATKEVQCTNNE